MPFHHNPGGIVTHESRVKCTARKASPPLTSCDTLPFVVVIDGTNSKFSEDKNYVYEDRTFF